MRRHADDSQLSEGLVSAARMIVSAANGLYDSTNALLQGYATEEKLTSAAKQVSFSFFLFATRHSTSDFFFFSSGCFSGRSFIGCV
jgi:hypothetical protein